MLTFTNLKQDLEKDLLSSREKSLCNPMNEDDYKGKPLLFIEGTVELKPQKGTE